LTGFIAVKGSCGVLFSLSDSAPSSGLSGGDGLLSPLLRLGGVCHVVAVAMALALTLHLHRKRHGSETGVTPGNGV